MGPTGSGLLLGMAASLAVVHTAIGIDHAVPFVVLSRVQQWSLRRTLLITALCGVGHVGSAVVLGLLAVGLGVHQLEAAVDILAIRARRNDEEIDALNEQTRGERHEQVDHIERVDIE